MSKFSRNRNSDFYDDEEDLNTANYRDEIRNRRKLKRMKNAIKARRVDDLLDMDDDDY
jgi:hypothetical protein